MCAACHGADGVSVAERIPHLAAQRAGYLVSQLQAFKDGTRKSDIMNAIAPQLSGEDIANLAAYFAALPGAAAGARSPLMAPLARTRITLPADLSQGHHRYRSQDLVESAQVQVFLANDIAWSAAAAGQPLPDGSALFVEVYSARQGADGQPLRDGAGRLVPDRVVATTAMARQAGWGDDIPALLRNENWQYAVSAPIVNPVPASTRPNAWPATSRARPRASCSCQTP